MTLCSKQIEGSQGSAWYCWPGPGCCAWGGCTAGYPAYGLTQWRYTRAIVDRDDGLDRFRQPPAIRMGALPFPGITSLWSAADPEDLGPHAYRGSSAWGGRGGERSRGLIYTEQLGFIDVAHLRNTVDLAQHCRVRVRDAMYEGREGVTLKSAEPSLYHVTWSWPKDWSTMGDDERRALIEAWSLRIGLQVAHRMATWHEVITWYGYKGWLLFPETRSSFTWDDSTSHALAMRVAGLAMSARPGSGFDAVATEALTRSLREAGAVGPAETLSAAEAVEGWWWDGHQPVKRLLDFGVVGHPPEFWLSDGRVVQGGVGSWYAPPGMADVAGRDLEGLVRVRIEPNIGVAKAITRSIGLEDGAWLEPERDFPRLRSVVLRQMEERLGAGCDRLEALPVVEGTRSGRAQPAAVIH